ncbi:MAG: ATPase domain-containing protein, partial [Thermoplasmata archaeon]
MVADGRVSTGISGLDRMLGGGLHPGRPYLVTGGTGSGKTLLSMSFLREGLLAGENVLLVAVDEPPMEIMENVREFGWDLSAVRTMDANPGVRAIRKNMDVQEIKGLQDLKTMREMSSDLHRQQQESDDITIQSIQLKLKQQLSNERFQRVVIDSITSIRRFAIRGGSDTQAERTEVQSLLRFLSEQGVTALITSTPSNPGLLAPEEILTRGEILLTRKWVGDHSVRQIKIVRMRGSAHD